jgi:hypothetical protein
MIEVSGKINSTGWKNIWQEAPEEVVFQIGQTKLL